MFTWVGEDITKSIKKLSGVKKITIATAFFSEYGLNQLRRLVETNTILPKNLIVYLSMDFSDSNPVHLLQSLLEIATPHIVIRSKLHAKVFLFEGMTNLLITGSSNFTKGGFQDNLEFNYISDTEDLSKVHSFFSKCCDRAIPVNDMVIDAYNSTESERIKVRTLKNSLHNLLNATITSDAFNEADYPNLDNQYFNYSDYETLFEKNGKRKDIDIDKRRKTLQKKLLAVNALVKNPLNKNGLVHHWRSENITSTIVPLEYNRFQVEWCGVRYTRKETAQYIQEMKLAGEGYGFPKYACLQFCLLADRFAINLFHAVKHEAVDRDYFYKAILSKEFCDDVATEIKKLQGYNLFWYAGDGCFSVDDDNASDFIEWYKENDRDGAETYLARDYKPDDPVLKSAQSISNEFVKFAKILLPLFDKVSFGWQK